MPDCLVLVLLVSVAIAGLAYWHARRLHWKIEELSPGFNALMRATKKGTRRP